MRLDGALRMVLFVVWIAAVVILWNSAGCSTDRPC